MDYWQQQTTEPLFPNLLWSRPETTHGAGKLLVIGGQAQEFIAVADAFAHAEQAGAGTVRVFMPESTRKVTKMLPNIEYAPSNTSGSFAKAALAELVDASMWSDGVLLAGNIGKNSETNLMLENFMLTHNGLLVIGSEALQSITLPAKDLFHVDNIVLTLPFDEIQKFGIALGLDTPIVSSIGNPEFARILHDLTTIYPCTLIIERAQQIWTARNGRIASTPNKKQTSLTAIAAEAAVWAMQNPNKLHEAVATAVWQATQ